LVRINLALCATALVNLLALSHAFAAETVIRCDTVIENDLERMVCAPQPVTDKFQVPLPDTAPPLVTGEGTGLKPEVSLPLPEEPAPIVIPQTATVSPAPAIKLTPPAEPPTVVIAVPPLQKPAQQVAPTPAKPAAEQATFTPPAVPPQPATPAPVEATKPPAAPVQTGEIPSDIMKAAVQKLRGTRLTPSEIEAVGAFYESRGFKPAWLDNGKWNTAGASIRARLLAAGDDGLDASAYPSIASFVSTGEPQWHALASADLQLTTSALLYAREAATGRINPRQVNAFITPDLTPPAAAEVLKTVSTAPDAGAALQGFNPPQDDYRALRNRLADLRKARADATPGDVIPDGPILRIGMRDNRVPLIRARLGLGYSTSPVYDRNIATKIAEVQRTAKLPVNSQFTSQTRLALANSLPSAEEGEIIANMERWRWLPRDLGRDHIMVNIPAFSLDMKRNGTVVHQARVIIGTGETQTPVFSDMMDHIVVNPSWFVPPSILKKDPRYLDPEWTAARGYTIRKRGENVTVRVPPGASNALGYVKFMFPNDHAVYLHDTPMRGLFGARNRLLSNGCVRVEHPFKLAAAIFADQGWTEERFKRMIGGGEQHMKLSRKLPIHLAYFTLKIGADGTPVTHPDVYGHSARLRRLLGLS
jgi:L,D-transpeptidase YcbB